MHCQGFGCGLVDFRIEPRKSVENSTNKKHFFGFKYFLQIVVDSQSFALIMRALLNEVLFKTAVQVRCNIKAKLLKLKDFFKIVVAKIGGGLYSSPPLLRGSH